MVCRVSVLFPMPGSPPSRVMLPGTIPPPSTRFSSSSIISMRGSSIEEMSRNFIGLASLSECCPPNMVAAPPCLMVMPAFFAACDPESAAILISLNVFHCPQLGHLPIHLALSCPQLLQTYAILSLAIFRKFSAKVQLFSLITKTFPSKHKNFVSKTGKKS